MKIAFNPSTVAALTTPPNNKDITFDLRGRNIFARGVKFQGTDTWRDIKINNVSIGSNILDLRNGSNTTLTNTNGVVTINSTWRPVVDNLTSNSTTSSLSANQGRVLKSLIDGKSNSGHTHDDRYLKLTGGTMASNALITFADSGSWGTDKGPQGARGGLYWTGQSDYAKLYAEETAGDNLDLVIQFGDDNSNGLSIRNKANTQTSYISAGGVITTGTFKGNLDWSYITNKPSSYTPSAHTHAWNSLTHSSTTENQAILTNGKANGWKLYTLNISRWDNAANNAHSHSNKSVLDGITSALVNNWNIAYNFVSNITGTDTDKVINKWEEIVNFLAGITEDNKLNTLLNSKLSVYELANNTNVGAIKNNGIYYSTTDASSGTLTNSPFNTGFALINMTSYDGGDDLRRSRLAFNAYGEIKVSDDRDLANTAETWYNILTSKNSGISGSTIKLNGTSITVYSSSTTDGRYVKKSGDTMSGVLTIDTTNFGALTIKRNDDANGASIQFRGKSSVYGYIGLNNSTKDKLFLRWNSDASKTYIILDTSSTYTSNGKGVINGTTITQVDNATSSSNADKVDGYHATSGNNKPWGTIPVITAGGYMDIGKHLEFHHDNTTGSDYSTILRCTGNYANIVNLPSANGTLALTSDIPTSLRNPYSLTLLANGTTLATYDGSVSKIVNLTYDNVGASAKNHTHNSLEPWASYITGDSHATALKSIFNKNKTSIPRNKFISMLSSAYDNTSYYMGYFLNGYNDNPYGGFFVAHYDTAYYVGISNGSFTLHRLVYSTDIPNSLKNPHALTISLNGTSQGPYDGSAAKSINITPGSIGAATSGHNHDNRYLKLTGGTMQLGEGLKFHADKNYFGTDLDARIISLLDGNDKVCDGGLIIDERATLDGKEYVTELLRIRNSEFKWKGSNILHSGNSNINGNTITINGSSLTVSKSDHTHAYLPLSGGNISGTVSIRKDLSGNLNDWILKLHNGPLEVGRASNTMCVAIGVTDDNYGYIQTKGKGITTPGNLVLLPGGGNLYKGDINNVIWHAGNDGANSGLDADLLDGNHASAFATVGHTHLYVTTTSFNGLVEGTVATYKNNIHNALSDMTGIGKHIVVSDSIINNWSNDSASYTPSSVSSIISINGGYDGRTFGQFLVASWNLGLGLLKYNNGSFQNIKWFSTTDHTHSYLPLSGGTMSNTNKVTNLNADLLDGYNANGLLTALSNSNNGISITVGGTTKSISNISVNYANSAGNADTLDGFNSTKFLRQVIVPNNTENDFNTFSNMTLTGRTDPTTGASLKNAPWSGSGPAGGYGVLTYLFSVGGYGTQMAWEYGSNRIYIRNKHWGGSEVGAVWKTSWDKLALTTDIPSSLKNPYALTLKANGTILAIYDGSSSKEANFTYANVGAAPASHTHTAIVAEDLRAKYPGLILDPRRMKLSFLAASTLGIKNDGSYYDVITVRSYGDSTGGSDNALLFSKNTNSLYHTRFAFGSTSSWGSPLLIIDSGNIGSLSVAYASKAGSVAWDSITGKPSSFAPSSHTHSWASITDKLVGGNEFNIANAGFNSDIWFNYVPINDRSKTATITGYHFGNGHQGYAKVTALGFVKNGSSSSYVLLGDGGHQTISSLSVNHANSAGYADSAGSVAWANITGKPSSLKNPYSLNIFGVAYDGSAAKTVTTSTFISLLSEDTSTVTDGTMFITSVVSNSGFADTNAVNVPYKRKASCLWNYIDSKVSSKYLPLAGGTMNGNARIGHGSGNLYIGNSGNDGWIYTQNIASQSGTDKWAIRTSGAAHFGAINIASKTDNSFNSNVIECNSTINLNYFSSLNVSLCNGGGTVQIGPYTTGDTGNNKLYVNGSEFINGASNVKDHVFANGFRHRSHNSDDAVLLAGGSYKTLNSIYGGNNTHLVFLGSLNLVHGSDGTISSSFQCLGYTVPFTYTRGGSYCTIRIPDTTDLIFYLKAAIASVNYSGGGMDNLTGEHRGDGAWWLHCYAYGDNAVRVKGFHVSNGNNDSWWGGNPLYSDNGSANIITVCLFGYVDFK